MGSKEQKEPKLSDIIKYPIGGNELRPGTMTFPDK